MVRPTQGYLVDICIEHYAYLKAFCACVNACWWVGGL